jgi:hypothetical protein
LPSYEEAAQDPTEMGVSTLGRFADVVIDTGRCTIPDVTVRCFWQLALAHFGGLIWLTLGTLKFRGNVLFCWSGARRGERKQNGTATPPGVTSFASFPAFFGNGTTRRRSR